MFCPKCAKPFTDEVQFCQQCGTALEGVRSLLEAGEAGGPGVVVKEETRSLSPRREGYRRGFVLAVVALLILPFYPVVENLLNALIPSVENSQLDELPLGVFSVGLFVLFAAGVARMLYARLFESTEAPAETAQARSARLQGRPGGRQLPPSQSIPVEEFFNGRANTAEPAARPSVTEHTTRSLRID